MSGEGHFFHMVYRLSRIVIPVLMKVMPIKTSPKMTRMETMKPHKRRERITTYGETALHMAACEMYPEMVKLLLDFGADPNVRTVD
jgi:hypothetical protein